MKNGGLELAKQLEQGVGAGTRINSGGKWVWTALPGPNGKN